MTISEIRAEFKSRAGLPSMTDVEADKWLNRGVKFLDITTNFSHSPARQSRLIIAGAYKIEFDVSCRSIFTVWILDKILGRTKLDFLSPYNFKVQYPLLSTMDRSKPIYYTFGVPLDTNSDTGAGYEIEGDELGYEYRSLLVGPPADTEYMLEVFGRFYTTPFSTDAPENWWSQNHPDAIIAAALMRYQLLVYKNTEGAKDYANYLLPLTVGLDYDDAEDEANNVSQMEG